MCVCVCVSRAKIGKMSVYMESTPGVGSAHTHTKVDGESILDRADTHTQAEG